MPTWHCTISRSVDVSNDTIAPSQEEHADALGVRDRGKTWDSRTQENNVVNTTIIPAQEGHAESLGVRGSGSHKRFEEGVVNTTATPSQEEHADALGVRTRADNQHVVNTTSTPSQGEHADAIGVFRNFPNLRNTVSKSCLMKTSVNGSG